ncbi:DUF4148 domain-containing protein [Duganella sp. LX20W]|uniref:DUF4148 domain-containing protein n=1 Tax=Rugamonas brunnea TaxID=2758569 RepID=A0A7W2EPU2_9BURK|nr:DUF4148 domain-containing protein [Rugamonas brunnea]MBA5636429.1 DUF4148 domain-containing protein [Rugamonas brunnea]
MKTTTWIATLIIAASSTAFAADAPDATRSEAAGSSSAAAPTQPAATGLTREQVRAALFEARSKGEVPETEADMDVAQTRKHHPQAH